MYIKIAAVPYFSNIYGICLKKLGLNTNSKLKIEGRI